MMEKEAGSSLEASLVTDLALDVSESLRKALAVILRTDTRSVPSGGFNNRWGLAVQRIGSKMASSNMYL